MDDGVEEARALQRRLQALLGDSVPEELEAGEESTLSETFTVYDFDAPSAQSLRGTLYPLMEHNAAVIEPAPDDSQKSGASMPDCTPLPKAEEEVQEPSKPSTATVRPPVLSPVRAKPSPLELLRQRQTERQRARQKTTAEVTSGRDQKAEPTVTKDSTTKTHEVFPVDSGVRPMLPRAHVPEPTLTTTSATSVLSDDKCNADVLTTVGGALDNHSASPTLSTPFGSNDNHCNSPNSIPSAATESSSPGGQSVQTYDSSADDDDGGNSAGTRPDDSPRSPLHNAFQNSSPTHEDNSGVEDAHGNQSPERVVDETGRGCTTNTVGAPATAAAPSRGMGPMRGEPGSSAQQPLPAASLFAQCAYSHQDWLLNGSAVYPLALRIAVRQLRLLPPAETPCAPPDNSSVHSSSAYVATDHRGLPGPVALAASALAASRNKLAKANGGSTASPRATPLSPPHVWQMPLKPPALRPLVLAVKSYGGGRPLTVRGNGRVPIGRPVGWRGNCLGGQDGGSGAINAGGSRGSDDGDDAHFTGTGSDGAEAVVLVRSPTESLSLELLDDGRTPEPTTSNSLASPQSSPLPARALNRQRGLEVAQTAAAAAPPPPPPCAWRAVVAGIELPLALPPPLAAASTAPLHPCAATGNSPSSPTSLRGAAQSPAAVAWTGWVELQDRCGLPPGVLPPSQPLPHMPRSGRRASVRGREAQEAAAAEAANAEARQWRGVFPWRLVAQVSLSWDPFQSARRRPCSRSNSWPLAQLSLPALAPQSKLQLRNTVDAGLLLPDLRLFVMVDRVEGLPPLAAAATAVDKSYDMPKPQQRRGRDLNSPFSAVATEAWSCGRCTFRNPASALECHMCGEHFSRDRSGEIDVGNGLRGPHSSHRGVSPDEDNTQLFACKSIACKAVLAWVARDGSRRPASASSSSSTTPSSVLASSTMRQRQLTRRLKRQRKLEAAAIEAETTKQAHDAQVVPLACDNHSAGGSNLRYDDDIGYGSGTRGAVLECCLPGELWPEEIADLHHDDGDDNRDHCNSRGRNSSRAQARWQQLQERYTSRRGGGSSSSSGTLALDVKGGSRRGGARVILWPARGRANQLWTFDPLCGGRLSPRHAPHLALDLRGGVATNNAPVVVWPYQAIAEPNQHWKLLPNGLMACRALPEQSTRTTKSGHGPSSASHQPWVLGLRRSDAVEGCRSGTSRLTLPADSQGAPWGPWCGAELVLVAVNSPRALRWRWSSKRREDNINRSSLSRNPFDLSRSQSSMRTASSETQQSLPSSKSAGAQHWGEVRSAVASGQFRSSGAAAPAVGVDTSPPLVHIGSAPPLPAWEVLPSGEAAEDENGEQEHGSDGNDNGNARGKGGTNEESSDNEVDDDDDELAQHDATVAALEKQLAKARRVGETEVASALAANLRDLLEVGETLALEQHSKQIERAQKKQDEALQRLAREEVQELQMKQKQQSGAHKDQDQVPPSPTVDTVAAAPPRTPEFSRSVESELGTSPTASPQASLPATPQTSNSRKRVSRSSDGHEYGATNGHNKTDGNFGDDMFFTNVNDSITDVSGGLVERGGLGDSDWSDEDRSDCETSDADESTSTQQHNRDLEKSGGALEDLKATPTSDLDDLMSQLSSQLTKARGCGESEIAEQLEADLQSVKRAKREAEVCRQTSPRSAGGASSDRRPNRVSSTFGNGSRRSLRVPVLNDGRGFTAVWPQPTRPAAATTTGASSSPLPSAFLCADVGGADGGRHGEMLELTLVEASSGKLVAGPVALPWECTCHRVAKNGSRDENHANVDTMGLIETPGGEAERKRNTSAGAGEVCECGNVLFTSWRSRPHSIPLKVRMPPIISRACVNVPGAPAHRADNPDAREVAASTDDGSTSSAASSQTSRYGNEHEQEFRAHGERSHPHRHHGSRYNINDGLWATVWMRTCWAHEAAPQVRALDATCAAQDHEAWLAAEAMAAAEGPPPPPPRSPYRLPRKTPKSSTASKSVAVSGPASISFDGKGNTVCDHERSFTGVDDSDEQEGEGDTESSPATEEDESVAKDDSEDSHSDEKERMAAACPVKVGDRVCVRDQATDPWEAGVVKALGSKCWPVVLVDGWTDAFAFAFYCLESSASMPSAALDSREDDFDNIHNEGGDDGNSDIDFDREFKISPDKRFNSGIGDGNKNSPSKKTQAGHLNRAAWLRAKDVPESADLEVAAAVETLSDEHPAEEIAVAVELASEDSLQNDEGSRSRSLDQGKDDFERNWNDGGFNDSNGSTSVARVLQNSTQGDTVDPAKVYPSKGSAHASEFIEHLVSPTDTCASVCLKYKVKASTLRRLNGFTGENVWHLRTLRVPNVQYLNKAAAVDVPTPPCTSKPKQTALVETATQSLAIISSPLGRSKAERQSIDDLECIKHRVLPSDTCAGICLKYKVKASTIRRLNGFTGDNIQACRVLQIPYSEISPQLSEEYLKSVPPKSESFVEEMTVAPATPPRLQSIQQSPTPERPQKTPLGGSNLTSRSGSKARIRSPLPISLFDQDKSSFDVDERLKSDGFDSWLEKSAINSNGVGRSHNQSTPSSHQNGGNSPEDSDKSKQSEVDGSSKVVQRSNPPSSTGFESPQLRERQALCTPTSAGSDSIANAVPDSVSGLTQRLSALLKLRANRKCADCSAKRPRWCSTSLGVFLCADCAAAHRALGPEVSIVRSVYASPDSSESGPWCEADVETMEAWGNARAAAVYEAAVTKDYAGRPQAHSDIEMSPSAAARLRLRWAKSKYKHLKFLPPPEAFLDLPPASRPIFNQEDEETTAHAEVAMMSENSSEVGPVNLERDAEEYSTQLTSERFDQESHEAHDFGEVDLKRAEVSDSGEADFETGAAATKVHTLMDDRSDLPGTETPSASAVPGAANDPASTADSSSSTRDPPWYAPGSRVAVKDDISEPWGRGTVKDWPMVRHDGWDEDFEWNFVRPLDAVLTDPSEKVADDPLSSLVGAASNHPLASSDQRFSSAADKHMQSAYCCVLCGHASISGAEWCAYCGAQPVSEWANKSSCTEGLKVVPEGGESGDDEDSGGGDDVIVGDNQSPGTTVSKVDEEDEIDEENYSDGGVEVLAAAETARLGPSLISASDEEHEEENGSSNHEGESIEEVSLSDASVESDPEDYPDYDNEEETQLSWLTLEDTDGFSGENALVVPLLGVAAARVIAERQRFGGFAVSRKTAYFRRYRGYELMNARFSKPGTVLHVLAPAREEVAAQSTLEVHVIGCSGLRVGGARNPRFVTGLRARVAFFSDATAASSDTELTPLAAFLGPNRRAAVSAPSAAVPSVAPPLRSLGKSVHWAGATALTSGPTTPFPTFEESLQIEGLSHDSSLIAAVLLSPMDGHDSIPQTPTLAAWARFVPLDSEGLHNGRHWLREFALELVEVDGSPGGVLQLLARWA